ncbi:hypothetical protein BU23DRAFT_569058 [Bimuria novae-zelandiae CBS 107.79]|uniref:Uncharacterized protein n=1 Tax=Bimuria novae-zelandiae CBS 107.79 TaxID=1447943 RepID=A0A6A5V5M8_9PLEO|nr:hypothetical protein BU23DRAFT_569058 [Bimuria novae-zelandiae CBS 107.79]
MKPAALFTLALLSSQSVSLTLPVKNQERAITDARRLSDENKDLSMKLAHGVTLDSHLAKRDWKDWAPSVQCVACMVSCVNREFTTFTFTYKVTKLSGPKMAYWTLCGFKCITEKKACLDKDIDSEDPFFRQSEPGRINSQYKENDMIENAGSSSPVHDGL